MQQMQVTVRYRVAGDHTHFRAEMTKSAPAIASIPGLVRNMWSLDPDSGLGTSVYLFESEAAARHFLAGPTLEHLLNGPGMGHEDVGTVSEIIRAIAKDRAVLMVEHNLDVVADLCHRITVLQRGEILAAGDYQAVSRDERVRTAYMGTEHG